MNKKVETLLRLVDHSYAHWTGRPLSVPVGMETQRLSWLDEQAPYGLLVQSTELEPLFIYANRQAQRIFGYSFEEFLTIPSSQSAPPEKQANRNHLLKEVASKGIYEQYQGTRIDKKGQWFEIERGSIWKVLAESGETVGIAAMIWRDDSN